jgi:hypothetical protein
MDDRARTIIEEALGKLTEEEVVTHLVQHVDELPEEVKHRLRLSLLEKTLRGDTERKNRIATFLEAVAEAMKKAGIKKD